jgi:hypothetical protein
MTSLKIIEEQIDRFLKSGAPEVIAIRGQWGTGKTYAWNKYLFNAKQTPDGIALSKYSYASLFGVNSLDSLKFSLFSNCVNRDEIDSGSEKQNIKIKIKNFIPQLKNWKGLNVYGVSLNIGDFLATALSYISVKETIICLDDFERMRLDAQDVLGLISELKEQKSCKIVLIMNNEGLSNDAKAKYQIYREKVIDKEFYFAPTPEECASIVFGNEDYENILKERCCKIGIKNIRIIKKICLLKDELIPFLVECEEETRHDVLSSLVLFTHSLYTRSDTVPNFEFIKKLNPFEFMLERAREQEQMDSEEKKKLSLWKDTLQSYGYTHSDELDLEIADSVERGYFISDEIKKRIHKFNDTVKICKQDRSHTEAWEIFHHSFDDNAEDFVQKMYEATKNHIAHISQGNLSASICIMRELGAADKADELIELAISSHTDPDYFNLEDYTFRERIQDPKMFERFVETYNQSRVTKTPLEVLKDITSGNGWGSQDEEVLACLSPNDYYRLFKAEKGGHLAPYVRRCLEFGHHVDASERQKTIARNVTEALKKIAAESDINRLRVKKFGIEE